MRKLEDIEAVIMVGGYSKRLRRIIGKDRHKSMVDCGGRIFLECLLDQLFYCGLRKFIFAVGHGGKEVARQARRICKSKYDIPCGISVDEQLTGTVNALIQLEDKLGDEFFVINGDTYSRISYLSMLAVHRERVVQPLATIAVSEIGSHIMGSFLFSKPIFRWIKKRQPSNIDYEFASKLVFDGESVLVYRSTSNFIDIGTPEGLRRMRGK